jgi:hypothetical protein
LVIIIGALLSTVAIIKIEIDMCFIKKLTGENELFLNVVLCGCVDLLHNIELYKIGMLKSIKLTGNVGVGV